MVLSSVGARSAGYRGGGLDETAYASNRAAELRDESEDAKTHCKLHGLVEVRCPDYCDKDTSAIDGITKMAP